MATNFIVPVVESNVEHALALLKKGMIRYGFFKELKRRAYYEKPSVAKRRKRDAAQKRRNKIHRAFLQRDRELEAQGR